jgi:hypothetical protein
MTPSQRKAWVQTALITSAAVGVFVGVRLIPIRGSDLHYTDFHTGGKSFLEFCEPGSPQFAPVDRIQSPVTLLFSQESPPEAGKPADFQLALMTSGGKPVEASGLLIVHTEKLHLLIIGPELDDYQHVHPRWENDAGVFSFSFTPKRAGVYKVFADFMPRATGRNLYAGGEIVVLAGPDALMPVESPRLRSHKLDASVDGLRFQLIIPEGGIRTNEAADIGLRVAGEGGASIVLEEVMGASAHVVAFDETRSGFAHLHPVENPADASNDGKSGPGKLAFSLFLPDPGAYRLWAQVKVAGRESFAPFDVVVVP